MRILFDQGTPVPLRSDLPGHIVDTAYELGWSELENGELLATAESDGYEVFITTDNNLQYQQNLTGRRISIIVLTTPSWPRIKKVVGDIRECLESVTPGSYMTVTVP